MVYLERCDSYDFDIVYEKIKKIFYELNFDQYFVKDLKVVIKPNLVAKKKPEEAATTHPSIVYAVARLFVENGADVIIAESPGGLYEEKILRGIYRVTGIEEATRLAGAKLNYDLGESEVNTDDNVYLKKLNVLNPIANADLIVNLSKLKTHGMMAYTGAVKNMFGTIAGLKKAEYHFNMPDYDMFANIIIDICLSSKPKINIIDAVVGMEKEGPTAGDPKKMDLLIASDNPFEADLVACDIIKANYDFIPVVRNSIKRNLCPSSAKEITIKGLSLEEAIIDDFIINYNETKSVHFLGSFLGDWVTKLLSPKPVFNKKLCVSCGECAACCPAKCITVSKGVTAKADLDKCIRCYCCQELCPFKAVTIKKPMINKLIIDK